MLTGSVSYEDGQPVPHASVMFSTAKNVHSILAYTVTDEGGWFSLGPVKADEDGWIVVRCLGFETCSLALETEAFAQPIKVTLRENTVDLPEVLAVGTMRAIRERGIHWYISPQLSPRAESNPWKM